MKGKTPAEIRPITGLDREYMIRSMISSQALSGLHVTKEEAEKALDKVMNEPLPDIR